MIRTPREWDEKCSECKGLGIVHKREHFSLTTPEEWSVLFSGKVPPPSIDQHKLPANAYVCSVSSGTIFEACREARDIAWAKNCPVAFEFNGHLVVVHMEDDPYEVAKEWWKMAHIIDL
jgi:hypothetical protein